MEIWEFLIGEVLYVNGPLGVLVGPGGADVWEVDAAHPLGNQMAAPAGAVGPAGDDDYTARNFRRPGIIGEQLAAPAGRLLDKAQKITEPRVSYRVQPFYTYLSNFGFRVLLVVDGGSGRTSLGHVPTLLYNCPLTGPKDSSTCTPDNYESATDPVLDTDFRVGDHLRSAVEYVRIGPVGMMFMPGEVPGELTYGLPAAFRSTPEEWYEEPPGTHALHSKCNTPSASASPAYRHVHPSNLPPYTGLHRPVLDVVGLPYSPTEPTSETA